ncbi:hypothetical protein FKM82_008327 [Ascaphus truei]
MYTSTTSGFHITSQTKHLRLGKYPPKNIYIFFFLLDFTYSRKRNDSLGRFPRFSLFYLTWWRERFPSKVLDYAVPCAFRIIFNPCAARWDHHCNTMHCRLSGSGEVKFKKK